MLSLHDFTAQGLLKSRNIELLCTTDDPLDDLSDHKKIAWAFMHFLVPKMKKVII
jgi:glucuronate isomerase